MLQVQLTDYSTSLTIDTVIADLDCKIQFVTGKLYDNVTCGLQKPTDYRTLKTLCYYKEIMNKLYWNASFYTCYNYLDILSRVKTLT